MNRELLKKAIKKLVLQEIANNQFGIPVHTDKKDQPGEAALAKAMGNKADVKQIQGSGKTAGVGEKQNVELSKNADDCYDVVSVTNESERKLARGVSLEAAMELVKTHAADSEKTYVQRARAKSLNSGKEVKKDKEDEKQEDTMEEVDINTQVDIADDNDVKAEEKVNKETAPIDKDNALKLGGNIVDNVEKVVDRILKNKADAKTAHLKADKEMESPTKLVVKDKGTPALKDSKKK